jgi:CheY-like chemotaxis protein
MSRRLLLADDSVTIQKVIEITLSDKDFILSVASNGDDALQMAINESPDLILADVFMPGLNGYELCEAVRNNEALKDIPVLLLAGTFEPFDEAKSRAASCCRAVAGFTISNSW